MRFRARRPGPQRRSDAPLLVASSLLATALVAVPGPAVAAEPEENLDAVTLSVDPALSLETGTDLTFSMVSLAARAENAAFSPLEARPALQRPLRAVWALFFDVPVAWWFGIYLHEAHGHGGRAREFGASAGYHLGSPWQGRSSYASFDPDDLTTGEILRVFSGGSEANGWAATRLERELVAGRAMRPLELLYLTANRLVVSDYVLRTTPHPDSQPRRFWSEWNGGGDVANYLGLQSLVFRGDAGISPMGASREIVEQYERLERQAIWNAADPGAWLALFTAWRTVFAGKRAASVPLPRVRGRRVLPVLSADWLLDGSVASLEVLIGPAKDGSGLRRSRWSSVVVRRGRGPAGVISSIGATTESFVRTARTRVGGEIELWRRPAGGGLGGGVRLRLARRGGRFDGFFVDLGAKSAGPWPGRPAESGPILRAGLRIPI